MEGTFHDGEENCTKVQEPTTLDATIFQATLPNSSSSPTIKMFFVANYNLRPLPNKTQQLIKPLARLSFFGIPCLHFLWSPGSREKYVHTEYPTWAQTFDDFYNSIQPITSFKRMNMLLGMPVAICEEKFGTEVELVNVYLDGGEFGDDPDKTNREFYNHGFKESDEGLLPPEYNGPIPVWKDFRSKHKADNALFDQTGLLECTVMSVQS